MKAAIYNPYLDTLGGGERYTLVFAKVLSDLGYSVDIEWKNKFFLKHLFARFGYKNDKNIKIVEDIKRGDNYDVCFWVSDGSIPILRAKRNFLHFQVPFKDVDGRSLLNKMKLFRIEKVICNSFFTKKIIDEEYGLKSIVVYPPVDVDSIKRKKKENIILYVGRFSELVQAKRQDILIKAFKEGVFPGYQLILAGGAEVGNDGYVEKLKKISSDIDCKIVVSPNYSDLIDLYKKSKIFWSAAGYDMDEEKEPQKTEHFGITAVEAMAGGCVPFLYNRGGSREIIDRDCGFLWTDIDNLVHLSKELLKDKKRLMEMSKKSVNKSRNFSNDVFFEKIKKIINEEK